MAHTAFIPQISSLFSIGSLNSKITLTLLTPRGPRDQQMTNKLVLCNLFFFFKVCACVCMYAWSIFSQIASVSVCRGPEVGSPARAALHQVVLLQVELQDGVLDGGEDETDVLCVGGTGEVRVDDLIAVRVQVHKHLEDKLSPCLGIPLWTWRGGNDAPSVRNAYLFSNSMHVL